MAEINATFKNLKNKCMEFLILIYQSDPYKKNGIWRMTINYCKCSKVVALTLVTVADAYLVREIY